MTTFILRRVDNTARIYAYIKAKVQTCEHGAGTLPTSPHKALQFESPRALADISRHSLKRTCTYTTQTGLDSEHALQH